MSAARRKVRAALLCALYAAGAWLLISDQCLLISDQFLRTIDVAAVLRQKNWDVGYICDDAKMVGAAHVYGVYFVSNKFCGLPDIHGGYSFFHPYGTTMVTFPGDPGRATLSINRFNPKVITKRGEE